MKIQAIKAALGVVLFQMVGCSTAMPGYSISSQELAQSGIVGQWRGSSHVVVSWSNKKDLSVQLQIGENQHVTGLVGDAVLVNGVVRKGRGRVLQWLGWGRDYLVVGDLKGYLVKDEGIMRDKVYIPFDHVGNVLKGGLQSSGKHMGGKTSMQLTARGMVLSRHSAAVTGQAGKIEPALVTSHP